MKKVLVLFFSKIKKLRHRMVKRNMGTVRLEKSLRRDGTWRTQRGKFVFDSRAAFVSFREEE